MNRTLSGQENKKLVLVGPAYPYRGGIAHFITTMESGLAARGHDLSIVTFSKQYPTVLFPGKTQYDPDAQPPEAPPPRLINAVGPRSWWTAARHIAQQQPDAVIFQYWLPFFGPAFGTMTRVLHRKGIPVLAVVHNALPHEPRPGDGLLSRYFLKACDGLVVMSDSVEADVRKLDVSAPVRNVPHPVYDLFGPAVPRREARAVLGLPDDAKVLLFFGFIRAYKGLHVLIESLPDIIEALPDVRLVVAGEFYEDAAPYLARMVELGLQDYVLLHDHYIPDDEVGRYFGAADLVVQPYVTATQSGVAQIAYHFEKPLVVTDVGGLAEVVPHEQAGLVVPPEDAPALTRAVVRFFEEDLEKYLREGLKEEKEKFSWDRLYEAVEALLDEV